MDLLQISVGLAVVFLIAYSYFAMVVSRWMQPTRLDVVSVGDELLESLDVPDDVKRHVDAICSQLNSRSLSWILVVGIPIRILMPSFWRKRKLSGKAQPAMSARNQRKYRFVSHSGVLCILANSPFAAVLVFIEIVILGILRRPVGAAVRAVAKDKSPFPPVRSYAT